MSPPGTCHQSLPSHCVIPTDCTDGGGQKQCCHAFLQSLPSVGERPLSAGIFIPQLGWRRRLQPALHMGTRSDSFSFAQSWPCFTEALSKCGKHTIRGHCVIDFWAQGPFLLAWKAWQVLFKELMNVNGHIICKS